jgi:small subunit ribosomal protein S15
MLTRTVKKKLIGKHQIHDKDTGSPHVQVAILSMEIDLLAKHLQEHPKDESARRGLLAKVAQRRKILNYLKLHNPKEYEKVLGANKLKK